MLDRVTDATLREEVDRFCRQEAQHYQRHVDFMRHKAHVRNQELKLVLAPQRDDDREALAHRAQRP